MADTPQGFTSPMAWWGVISASAAQHETTDQLWSRIHAETEARGWTEPPNLFTAVNEIRASASSLTYGAEHLAEARPAEAITARDMAFLPYGRREGEAALVRQFHVRVGYSATREGQSVQGYVTLQYTGSQLPVTVGALRDQAFELAGAYASTYGDELDSIDSIQIGEL